MELHWDLLITHAISFILAVLILKKYAWSPLLNLLEERRDKIKSEFEKIDDSKAEVESLKEDYESKLREIDNERRNTLTEAVNEGKKIAEEIKANAQQDAKNITEKAKAELEREVAKSKVQLKEDLVNMTLVAAGRIIKEKLDDAKHRQLISGFIDDVEKV